MSNSYDLIVIGGGAAGFFGAINAAVNLPRLRVIILEASRDTLKKVEISGGGRCNVTHACFSPELLVSNYPRGAKELLGPFHRFGPPETISWFEERGVKLKTEEDGRMFPVTDTSRTIIDCFYREVEQRGIIVETGVTVKSIVSGDSGYSVVLRNGNRLETRSLLIATGSSPAGHRLAQELGHTITPLAPSLFTFHINSPILTDLQGLSFSKATISLLLPSRRKPLVYTGPLLITHWGLSGPVVLKASAFAARELRDCNYEASIQISWTEETREEGMMQKLKQYRSRNKTAQVRSRAPVDVSLRFWVRLVDLAGVSAEAVWNSLSDKQLRAIAELLVRADCKIKGKSMYKNEFVTCGGVLLKEVDFRTMASKLHSDIYFAGEILDIDGVTGGFNFQNAWTTSFIAAAEIAQVVPQN